MKIWMLLGMIFESVGTFVIGLSIFFHFVKGKVFTPAPIVVGSVMIAVGAAFFLIHSLE